MSQQASAQKRHTAGKQEAGNSAGLCLKIPQTALTSSPKLAPLRTLPSCRKHWSGLHRKVNCVKVPWGHIWPEVLQLHQGPAPSTDLWLTSCPRKLYKQGQRDPDGPSQKLTFRGILLLNREVFFNLWLTAVWKTSLTQREEERDRVLEAEYLFACGRPPDSIHSTST